MAKKIIILCMSITMILFSSISIYAAENSNETDILVNPSANATTVDMESETIITDVIKTLKMKLFQMMIKTIKKKRQKKQKKQKKNIREV